MAEAAYNAGNDAFTDENFDAAVAKYTEAINLVGETNAADRSKYLLKRSAAHAKLDNHMEAVSDANAAIQLTPTNAMAYFRKGTALFALEEYVTARTAFQESQRLDASNAQCKTWLRKCDAELSGEAGQAPTASTATTMEGVTSTAPPAATTPAPAATTTAAPAAEPPKTGGVKHDWYQNDTYVYVTIMAKNTRRELTRVDMTDSSLSVSSQLPSAKEYTLIIDLCDKIVPAESSFENLSTKIEIRLKKANKAHWAALEASDDMQFKTRPVAAVAEGDVKSQYPSSSRKKTNWDTVAKNAEKDAAEEGDPLNKLFQQIYSGADENTRRAMNKSFVESNGTVLSTNWKEVGAKHVDGQAPKGMEMHSWKELETGKDANGVPLTKDEDDD